MQIDKSVFEQYKDNPEEFIIKAAQIINDEKATAVIQHITYNVLDDIYFITETKGSMNSMQLRLVEESKIHCAREHFKAISNGNVVYDVVDSYQSLLNIVTK